MEGETVTSMSVEVSIIHRSGVTHILTGIILLEGQELLQCIVCPQTLKCNSLAGHLRSAGHKKSEANYKAAVQKNKERQDKQNLSVAEKEAIEFAAAAAATSSTLNSAVSLYVGESSTQESALWSSLEQGDADAELTIESDHMGAQGRVQECLETFGLWDPTRLASQLGFHFWNETSQQEDSPSRPSTPYAELDTALLTELLQNIGLWALISCIAEILIPVKISTMLI